MDIRTEKLRLIELLLHTNDPSILKKIRNIFQIEEKQDIWDQLSYAQHQEIDQAIAQVQNGETVPFEAFVGKHK